MKNLEFLYAINGIDDEFITEAADDEKLKEAFCAEWGEEDGSEQTESDTAEEKQTKKKINKRTHKVRFKKILLVAVISILLFALSVGALAKYFDINLRDELYQIFGNDVFIKVEEFGSMIEQEMPKSSDLVVEIEKMGIPKVILPEALLEEEWLVTDFASPFESKVNISLTNGKMACSVKINHSIYLEKAGYIGRTDVKRTESVIVNGIEVIVTEYRAVSLDYAIKEKLENGAISEVAYTLIFYAEEDGQNITFEEALEIAKTIK